MANSVFIVNYLAVNNNDGEVYSAIIPSSLKLTILKFNIVNKTFTDFILFLYC